jgi:hypothetical protein
VEQAVPVPIQFGEGFRATRLVGLCVAPRTLPLRRLASRPLGSALVLATGAVLEAVNGMGPA